MTSTTDPTLGTPGDVVPPSTEGASLAPGTVAPYYRGASGAAIYAVLTFAFSLMAALGGSVALGMMTGTSEVAGFVFIRLLLFGLGSALAVGMSRWIVGAETNRLLSLRLARGDLGAIFGILSGLALASILAKPPEHVPAGTVSVGDTLEIRGPVLDGVEWSLADHAGQVVLVDFWATWCDPCVEELPTVRDIYNRFRERGLQVVGVSLDRSRAALTEFLEQHSEPWPQIYFDPAEGGNPLAERYQVSAIPWLVVIGRDGKVAAVDVRGREIERAVEAAIDSRKYEHRPAEFDSVLGTMAMGLLWSPGWVMVLGLPLLAVVGAVIERSLRGRSSPELNADSRRA